MEWYILTPCSLLCMFFFFYFLLGAPYGILLSFLSFWCFLVSILSFCCLPKLWVWIREFLLTPLLLLRMMYPWQKLLKLLIPCPQRGKLLLRLCLGKERFLPLLLQFYYTHRGRNCCCGCSYGRRDFCCSYYAYKGRNSYWVLHSCRWSNSWGTVS